MIKKIGLFGGSFNPIHNAHVKLIDQIIREKVVDEIWLIPCKKHNFNKQLLNARDRIKMIKLAISGLKNARINNIELKMRGKSCTLKTIRKLKQENRNKEFYIVIGADILQEIKKWYKYERLVKETKFVVFSRKGYKFVKNPDLRIEKIIDLKRDNISSSEIRQNVKQGKSISKLVPRKVEEYIKKNNLYF